MKLILLPFLLLVLSFSAHAQGKEVLEQKAMQYVADHQGIYENLSIRVDELRISSSHTSKASGITHVYLQQTHAGIDILNSVGSIHFDASGEIFMSHNHLKNKGIAPSPTPTTTAASAIASTARHFNLPTSGIEAIRSQSNGATLYQSFSAPKISSINMEARLVYVNHDGKLVLAWEIFLERATDKHMFYTYVDAHNNQVISKQNLTISCHAKKYCSHEHHTSVPKIKATTTPLAANSYNVFAVPLEAPNEGPRSVVVEPWDDAPAASPFGWHDTDGMAGAEFTITEGNNVRAYDDIDNNNRPGLQPDGGNMLMFDFPYDEEDDPLDYLDFSVTQLFYMNNIMHDVMFLYGFDEDAGNFQEFNYTGATGDGDSVNAEALDGSGTNNAYFSTPRDGIHPRMQMFRWTAPQATTFIVNAPAGLVGSYQAAFAQFGPNIADVTGDVVLSDDILACDAAPITNGAAINGHMALIDRGDCNFTEKVKNAQDVGAVAVIVCNNQQSDIFGMGGTDASITIPSIMISQADCATLRVSTGLNVTIVAEETESRDSDLDNGIIAHEYGHGVSTRLTGGKANSSCLINDEQMGEGWSDYLSLIMQLKDGDQGSDRNGIGTYVLFEGEDDNGIRAYPYSTDMSINPHTYNDVKDQWSVNTSGDTVVSVHGVGSIWNAMLWDMTWNLIDKHGFTPDPYAEAGGSAIALHLVMEGMKLQPCVPGFVDGRDAILAADEALYGGENHCEIWQAFARRGLGASADQGSSSSYEDGVAAFDLPSGCYDENIEPCTNEVLTYTNTTIPDATNERVNTTITIIDSDVASATDVQLRARNEITIPEDETFEVANTAVLFLKIIPCDVMSPLTLGPLHKARWSPVVPRSDSR